MNYRHPNHVIDACTVSFSFFGRLVWGRPRALTQLKHRMHEAHLLHQNIPQLLDGEVAGAARCQAVVSPCQQQAQEARVDGQQLV